MVLTKKKQREGKVKFLVKRFRLKGQSWEGTEHRENFEDFPGTGRIFLFQD